MASVRVRLKLRGLNALMSSTPVQAVVDSEGERMSSAAGAGFEYVAKPHPWTARGYVQVANFQGARRQARDAVLERVAGSRGG